MERSVPDQKILWDIQHKERESEHREIEMVPNDFAKKCLAYIPENGFVIEIGTGNARDARYFAREKNIHVITADFSSEAIKQSIEAINTEQLGDKVFPVLIDAKDIHIDSSQGLDAIYARSSLHLDDGELNIFLTKILPNLKIGGYVMVEGKTHEDFKMQRSKTVAPNLKVDVDGHARRAWDAEYIEIICKKYSLELINSEITDKNIKGNKTNFINFILQKLI